jgi:hypothetical protein
MFTANALSVFSVKSVVHNFPLFLWDGCEISSEFCPTMKQQTKASNPPQQVTRKHGASISPKDMTRVSCDVRAISFVITGGEA